MGFHARSTEDAVRWVLGLEGELLSDGYFLSFVLVNDSSPECVEFLRKHFVPLCRRTADRVRFVYFSSMTPEEGNAFFWGRIPRLTSLPRLLGIAPSSPGLADLHPQPLGVVRERDLRDIEADTSEFAKRAVQDGASAAMRFAQQLGIGQDVPCVLISLEVQERRTWLLPIAERDSDWVNQRITEAVDGFYRENLGFFARLRKLEAEIEALASVGRRDLKELQAWARQEADGWRALRALNRAVAYLDSPTEGQPPFENPLDEERWLGDELGRAWRESAAASKEAEVTRSATRRLEGLPGSLDTLDWDPASALDSVRRLLVTVPGCATDTRSALGSALDLLKEASGSLASPEQELDRWLRAARGNRPPQRAWRKVTGLPGELFCRVVAGIPMGGTNSGQGELALRFLAALSSAELDGAAEQYAEQAGVYLVRLLEACPRWVIIDGTTNIGDWIDVRRRNEKRLSNGARRLLAKRTEEVRDQLATAYADVAALASEVRDAILASLPGSLARARTLERQAHRIDIERRSRLGALLADRRASIERHLEENLANGRAGRRTSEFAREARKLLESYHQLVGMLQLADVDPEWKEVDVSWLTAVGPRGRRSPTRQSSPSRLRAAADEFVAHSGMGSSAAGQIQTPSDRLARALVNAVDEERLRELLAEPVGVKAVHERLAFEGPRALLGSLRPAELRGVLRLLEGGGPELPGHGLESSEPAEAVLAAAGVGRRPPLYGQQAFELELAAIDPLLVSPPQAGALLRRRLERYLKQFALGWGGLSGEIPSRDFLNASLGVLRDATIRLLKQRSSDSAHPIWSAARSRLDAVHSHGRSWGETLDALRQLTDLANPLCHDHIGRSGGSLEGDYGRGLLARLQEASMQVAAGLRPAYPVCLSFRRLEWRPGSRPSLQFEADSGPSRTFVFEQWPPSLSGLDSARPLAWLSECYLLLMEGPSDPLRDEPALVPFYPPGGASE